MFPDSRVATSPTGAALGAEIRDIDLRVIDDAAFAAIYRAWLDHQVLLVRKQRLSDADLIAFSRRFGDLDLAPVQENGRRSVEGHPEIYVVSKQERAVPVPGAALSHTRTRTVYSPDMSLRRSMLSVRGDGSHSGARRLLSALLILLGGHGYAAASYVP